LYPRALSLPSGISRLQKNMEIGSKHRKRILVVNCYFDDTRLPVPRRGKLVQATAPIYLAGAFAPELCEVRLYNEQYDGPISPVTLAWPDMLVLSGLTNSFDRMLHLTAYARSQNPRVVVVAGGPAVRALPLYSRRFFDYACEGDIEQMQDVICDAFGTHYVAEQMAPRFELANWLKNGAYVETTRNCNFRCAFCTIAAEGRPYTAYSCDSIRRDIVAAGYNRLLVLTDNNCYGNSSGSFAERAALLRELHEKQCFGRWGGCVTNDFFLNPHNIELARQSGCIALFSGVESFDSGWLRSMNKLQNTVGQQNAVIGECLAAGILFFYGLIFDTTRRTVADLRQELDFILHDSRIPFPTFFAVPIPLPRTRFFYECLEEGLILPNTRWRDLDPTTISLRTASPLAEAVDLVRDLQSLRGYRAAVVRHTTQFFRTHRNLDRLQQAILLNNVWQQATYEIGSTVGGWLRGVWRGRRSHVSSTEILDAVYSPAIHLDAEYESYFRPTRLTDATGSLADELEPDLATPTNASTGKAGYGLRPAFAAKDEHNVAVLPAAVQAAT
jgi:hypothetical protein